MGRGKKKQIKRTAPAQRDRRNIRAVLAAGACGLLLLCLAAALLLLRASQRLTVCTIDDHPVTQAELQYCYIEQIASYQDKTGRLGNAENIGPDFSSPLSEQSCPLTSGISWHTYFINAALRQLKVEIAAAAQARREGFTGGETVEEAVRLRLAAVEAAAEEAGLSTAEYLRRRYGGQVTMELVREIETRTVLSVRYLAASVWDCPIDEAEIEARFAEQRRWNMTASYQMVPLDCSVEKREEAAAAVEGAVSQEDFSARCAGYCGTDPLERTVLHTDAAAGEMEDYAVAEWVLDEARQFGDTTVVSIYDEQKNQSRLAALYFTGAQRNTRKTYTYQEILLMPDRVEIDSEAHCWGVKQVGEMELSALDEEGFGTLALAYSSLASAGRLGIRTLDAGSLQGQSYAEWLVDGNRRPGDSCAFETEYGVYLIRFIGEGAPYWLNNVEEDLRNEAEAVLTHELALSAGMDKGLLFDWLINCNNGYMRSR